MSPNITSTSHQKTENLALCITITAAGHSIGSGREVTSALTKPIDHFTASTIIF
jgi:hypothetical protein